jgi:peptidoglycan-associated lipoprotein
MNTKFLSVLALVVAVSACSSDKTADNGSGMGDQNNIGNSGGMTSTGVTPGTEKDLAQNVGDRIHFDTNRSDLNTEARATLDRQAAWLKKYANLTVTVEGNCDERGTREYNLALGERRAEAAKRYLIASGIAASRVQTVSYGKERPEVVGSDEQAWAQNRRDVTVVN